MCTQTTHIKKTPAADNILNKFIKNKLGIMHPVYNYYFNVISGKDIIPDALFKGTFFPICNRSGDPTNPENCRPFTQVSCFSILFVSIVSARF